MLMRVDWIICPKDRRCAIDGGKQRENKPDAGAIYFRHEFTVYGGDLTGGVSLDLSGLGYATAFINGKRVGDMVLEPCQSDYSKRVYHRVHDVTGYLREGSNCIGIVACGGFYNGKVDTIWGYDNLPFQDAIKVRAKLRSVDGVRQIDATSANGWRTTPDGPIVYSQVRSGETYDARLEMNGWSTVGFDDSSWVDAHFGTPPGGVLAIAAFPPCRIVDSLLPNERRTAEFDGRRGELFTFGRSISGVAKLRIRGAAGTVVTLRYGDKLDCSGGFMQSNLTDPIFEEFQTDRYILKGEGVEEWSAEFVWHGFQFIFAEIDGNATLEEITALETRTDFARAGEFVSSDLILNTLARNNENAFLCNFVGVPTDCPTREKRCWSGDALIAHESGMYSFDAAMNYGAFFDCFAEEQYCSGAVPPVLHTAMLENGCGPAGVGPAWDGAFILMAWTHYLFTGDSSRLRRDYGAYCKLVDFYLKNICEADSLIVNKGLSDWWPPPFVQRPPVALTSTVYFYAMVKTLSKIASLTGHSDDVGYYDSVADRVKDSFNREFYKGDGIFGAGNLASISCPIYWGLVDDRAVAEKGIAHILNILKQEGYRSLFGILGAVGVCRLLGEEGYADELYSIFTQREYPGWAWQIDQGATSLWECWDGHASCMHVMFGDPLACLYRYFAGIRPDEAGAGFAKVTIHPLCPKKLDWVRAYHDTPYGRIVSQWERSEDGIVFNVTVPNGVACTFEYNTILQPLAAGVNEIVVKNQRLSV